MALDVLDLDDRWLTLEMARNNPSLIALFEIICGVARRGIPEEKQLFCVETIWCVYWTVIEDPDDLVKHLSLANGWWRRNRKVEAEVVAIVSGYAYSVLSGKPASPARDPASDQPLGFQKFLGDIFSVLLIEASAAHYASLVVRHRRQNILRKSRG